MLQAVALWAGAQQMRNITVDGKTREMLVYVPAKLPPGSPLVISLHGANQDAAFQQNQTHWNEFADTANFAVVYPNAINKFWDVNGKSDVRFIEEVIARMYRDYDIDLCRVYVSGFSLGAMMTYHCMEHLGDRIAAFGPVSGVRFDNRAPQAPRRVPFIHTHGTGDDVFKWTGDLNHAAGGYPYIPDYVQKWAVYEDLDVKTDIKPYPASKPNSIASMTRWTSSEPGDTVEIRLLAIEGKGHWHSEDIASGVSTTQEIWNFCKRYRLNEAPELPEEPVFDPEAITVSMWHEWDDCLSADAKAVKDDCGCVVQLDTELSQGNVFAGPQNGVVPGSIYADLSAYDGIYIKGTPGISWRGLFNRKEMGDNGATIEVVVNLDDNGEATILFAQNDNLKNEPFIHLNSAKVGWGSPSGRFTTFNVITKGSSAIEDVTVSPEADGSPLYNLSGIRVDDSYKGIVIRNGRKYVNR